MKGKDKAMADSKMSKAMPKGMHRMPGGGMMSDAAMNKTMGGYGKKKKGK